MGLILKHQITRPRKVAKAERGSPGEPENTGFLHPQTFYGRNGLFQQPTDLF